MSIKVMSLVWESDLEQDEKLVLLAYADHAEDDGSNIFPSQDRVAWKTGYSVRQIQRITKKLIDRKIMFCVGESHRRTKLYVININNLPKRPSFVPVNRYNDGFRHDKMSPPEILDTTYETVGDDISDIGDDIAMSYNSSLNHQLISGESEKEEILTEEDVTFFKEGVDRAKENAQRPKPSLAERRQSTLKALERSLTNNGADLGQYPEHLRSLARAFIEESKVVPFNNERKYWIKGLTDIYERGFDPLLVIRAVRKMRDDHLTIKSPQSIVAVAQELAIRSMQLDEDRRFSEEY